MAAFSYKAMDKTGRNKSGVLEADNAKQIRAQLRDKGLIPLEVEQIAEKEKGASRSDGRQQDCWYFLFPFFLRSFVCCVRCAHRHVNQPMALACISNCFSFPSRRSSADTLASASS